MRHVTRWFAVVIVLTAACAGETQVEEVLANPGFEELDDAGRPAGWRVDEGLQVLSGEDAYQGEHAVRVRYHGGLRQSLEVEAGEMYRVTGYTRRPPGEPSRTGRVLVRWLGEDGAKMRGNSDYRHTATGDWSRFTYLISIPSGYARIELVVDGPYQTTEWYDFDGLSMTRTNRLASISPTAIDACNRPLRAMYVADCDSFALLRLPRWMDRPCDGDLGTAATMSPYGERPNPHTEVDFDFTFHRPQRVSVCLVHTIAQPLKRATLLAERGGEWRELATLTNRDRTLLAAVFDPVTTRRMRLRVHKEPAEDAISLNEVQFFGPGVEPSAPLEGMGLTAAEAVPADFAEVLERVTGEDGPDALALAAGADAGGGPVELAAEETLEVLLPAAEQRRGLDHVRAELVCEGTGPDRALEIAIICPNIRDRDLEYIHMGDRVLTGRYAGGRSMPANVEVRDLARVVVPLTPADGGVATATLDCHLPGTLIRPGERLWLRVTALQDETLLPGESTVATSSPPVEEVLPEYVADLERILRRAYAECSEAHVYDSAGEQREEMALVRLVREVLALDPDNEAARKIQHRVMRTRERVELERPGPVDAPGWAVWQRKLLREYTEVVHWWIDHRQISTGELDGMWADDTELTCEWAFLPLVTGDEKVRRSLEMVAEGIWDVVGDGGYSPRTMDAEHAAEYVTLSQPQMMLIDYGNPLYVERCMRMIQNMQWWTIINEQGYRHFRSYMFNATSIDDSEGKDFDNAHTAYACKPGFYVAWYSANEQPRGWLTEWARGWHAAAMSTVKDKPLGAIPCDIHARTGEIAPYTDAWNRSAYMAGATHHIKDLFLAAWDWSGDPELLAPFRYQGTAVHEPDMVWRIRTGDTSRDEAIIEGVEGMIRDNAELNGSDEPDSWSAYNMYAELRYYWAWWATGEMRYLEEGLREQCRNMERMRWLITEAEPYTDRAYIPGDRLLPFMMLGGTGSEVRANYPDFAVRWEGIGRRVATLVTERSDDRLRVLAYSFADEPIEAVMRAWTVTAGRWEVSVGVDRDGAGEADETLTREEVELHRNAPVPVELQPGVTTVIEAELIEGGEDPRTRPDLAIAPLDVRREGDELVVTVHNIGAADAPEGLIVAAVGENDARMAEAELPVLPAPVNCEPSTVEVRLTAAEAERVLVDAEAELAEITERNNVAEVRR